MYVCMYTKNKYIWGRGNVQAFRDSSYGVDWKAELDIDRLADFTEDLESRGLITIRRVSNLTYVSCPLRNTERVNQNTNTRNTTALSNVGTGEGGGK